MSFLALAERGYTTSGCYADISSLGRAWGGSFPGNAVSSLGRKTINEFSVAK